jgi:magnesium-transporting ATPase (P-type)
MDIILPFFLIFVITYAALQKSKILGTEEDGKPKKNFNVIISLIISISVIVPHVTGGFYGSYYSPQYDVVNIINNALPNIALITVSIVMLFLLLGIWSGPADLSKSNYLSGFAVMFSMAAVLFIFLSSAGVFGSNWSYWFNFIDYRTRSLLMIILVFGLVVYFIVREPPNDKPDKGKFFEELGKVLSK